MANNLETYFQIYQRESMQFYINSDPPFDYSDQLVNIIIKNTDDTREDNVEAIINKTKLLSLSNIGSQDYNDAKNGIIKINLDSTETNVDATEYKFMIQITDNNNTTANVLVSGILKVLDNNLKKI